MKDGNAKINTSERRAAAAKRAQREKMRAAGFTLKQYWVHPEDSKKVAKNIKKLIRARLDMSLAIA